MGLDELIRLWGEPLETLCDGKAWSGGLAQPSVAAAPGAAAAAAASATASAATATASAAASAASATADALRLTR